MAAECMTCGESVKHKPGCAMLAHIKTARLVCNTVSAFLRRPKGEGCAFTGWRNTVRVLALMLAEDHPEYSRATKERREWSDNLEATYRAAMGLEGDDDCGAGENPD